ncbi:hypothetical protein JCM10213v2_007995 [Rhodosporidiobolus nylandii]
MPPPEVEDHHCETTLSDVAQGAAVLAHYLDSATASFVQAQAQRLQYTNQSFVFSAGLIPTFLLHNSVRVTRVQPADVTTEQSNAAMHNTLIVAFNSANRTLCPQGDVTPGNEVWSFWSPRWALQRSQEHNTRHVFLLEILLQHPPLGAVAAVWARETTRITLVPRYEPRSLPTTLHLTIPSPALHLYVFVKDLWDVRHDSGEIVAAVFPLCALGVLSSEPALGYEVTEEDVARVFHELSSRNLADWFCKNLGQLEIAADQAAHDTFRYEGMPGLRNTPGMPQTEEALGRLMKESLWKVDKLMKASLLSLSFPPLPALTFSSSITGTIPHSLGKTAAGVSAFTPQSRRRF